MDIYDDMIAALTLESDQCCIEARQNKTTLDDQEYQAGVVCGLTRAISLIRAAKLAIVQIPHLGLVS